MTARERHLAWWTNRKPPKRLLVARGVSPKHLTPEQIAQRSERKVRTDTRLAVCRACPEHVVTEGACCGGRRVSHDACKLLTREKRDGTPYPCHNCLAVAITSDKPGDATWGGKNLWCPLGKWEPSVYTKGEA